MIALLGFNCLIALLDAAHQHHARARSWLQANIAQGWASCPLTQNGCIRILSQPAYPGAQPPAAVAERLAGATATATRWYSFWPDDISLLETGCLDWQHILGSHQLIDAYLLALAVRRGGRLVTFDHAISPVAVPGTDGSHVERL